jgi:hypothetical protein
VTEPPPRPSGLHAAVTRAPEAVTPLRPITAEAVAAALAPELAAGYLHLGGSTLERIGERVLGRLKDAVRAQADGALADHERARASKHPEHALHAPRTRDPRREPDE